MRTALDKTTTSSRTQDLILFAQDASFSKVPEAPGGRTYVLKFTSSNAKHFVRLSVPVYTSSSHLPTKVLVSGLSGKLYRLKTIAELQLGCVSCP